MVTTFTFLPKGQVALLSGYTRVRLVMWLEWTDNLYSMLVALIYAHIFLSFSSLFLGIKTYKTRVLEWSVLCRACSRFVVLCDLSFQLIRCRALYYEVNTHVRYLDASSQKSRGFFLKHCLRVLWLAALSCITVLPHKVKRQYLHFRSHAEYFSLPWKIPEVIADDQSSSITKGSIYSIKHYVHTPF